MEEMMIWIMEMKISKRVHQSQCHHLEMIQRTRERRIPEITILMY